MDPDQETTTDQEETGHREAETKHQAEGAAQDVPLFTQEELVTLRPV